MQIQPKNWGSVFAGPHNTEYLFEIDGKEYTKDNLQQAPTLKKPLMDQPIIGRCNSGTLTLLLRLPASVEIAKAAPVVMKVRLSSKDGSTVTDWVEKGHFLIANRKRSNGLLQLTCRDHMLKAGDTYADKTAIEVWPAPMSDVVAEIAQIMGVELDPRTIIKTGADYVVSRPSYDTLMSEVLSMIGAAHGGNWVMSDTGLLRLILFSGTADTPVQEIGSNYRNYLPVALSQVITRGTLEDDAGNKYTVGTDEGLELVARCDYATQEMVNALALIPVESSGDMSFVPYELTGAYLDPCVEVGDTVSITQKGNPISLVVAAMSIRCSASYVADLSFSMELEDEDEFPYSSLQELEISRAVSTHKSYYGNRINRENGFVSERIVDGLVAARMTANADVFAMQQYIDGAWQDRIYFDAVEGKYRITGDVEVEGAVTITDLSSPQEQTFIDGGNIITGTLSASTITTGILKSQDESIVFDLDNNKLTVGGDDILDAIAKVDNQVQIVADSQMFGRAEGAEEYAPAKITLTVETRGEIVSQQWYKDGKILVGSTAKTLEIIPTDIAGAASTYSVICKDQYENEYTDFLTVAKVSSGEQGSDGYNTTTVYLYKRSKTAATIDWDGSLKYLFNNPPHLESVPSGWSEKIPAGTDPLYVTTATAYSNISYDFIPKTEWSAPVILSANGADGAPGFSTAIAYLYKRSATAPTIDWTGSLKYSFSAKGLVSVPAGWSQTVPTTGTAPLYMTAAAAFGNTNEVSLPVASWSTPAMLAENGEDGTDGLNTATVFLYIRSANTPSAPTGDLTYTFASGALSGSLSGWSQDVPDIDGNPCFIIQATASARAASDTIKGSEWSTPVKLVKDGADGKDGVDGSRGTGILAITTAPTGYTVVTEGVKPSYRISLTTVATQSGVADPRIGDVLRYSFYDYPVILVSGGYVYTRTRVSVRGAQGAQGVEGAKTAVVYLYKRAETKPTVDWTGDLTYSFADKKLTSVPSGWSEQMVDGYDPLYVVTATAYGTGDTDTIAVSEWSAAVKLAEDGTDGLNTATVFLYIRSANTPSAPTGDLTYTFATGEITGSLSGWSKTLPDIDGNPCYIIQATAASRLTEDIIRASEWSTPVKLVEDGYNTATVFLYQRKNTTPSKPSGNLVYTFATGALSGTLGDWSKTIPGNDGNACYVIQASAISPNSTYTIPSSGWSSPVPLVENGTPGAPGADGYTALLSREYVMENVDASRKPTTAETVNSIVSVYKGLTPLTATKNAPAEGQFKVTIKNTISGITVTQSIAGTISMIFSKSAAIADTSVLQLEISLSDGMTIQKNIIIQANMNAIVATHESSIKTLEDEIVLKVSEVAYHTQLPTYSSSDPSVSWTAADKTANVGYLWYDTTNKVLKKWDGAKWVTAPEETWAAHSEAAVDLTATKIGWIVKSGESESDFTMTDRAMEIATSNLSIVAEDNSASYYVEQVNDALYGFEIAADGFYTSQNAGIGDSRAWCRVRIYSAHNTTLNLECINYAEKNYDFGMIGKLDTALSNTVPYNDASIFKNFYSENGPDVVIVPISIPAGEHFFDVQYIKDASDNIRNDSFKFKLPTPVAASKVTIKSGETYISSTNIVFSGIVTFDSLSTSGATVINGDNITTGTLKGVQIVSEDFIETTAKGDIYGIATLNNGSVMWRTELRDTYGNVIQNESYTRAIGGLKVEYDDFWTGVGDNIVWGNYCISLESDAFYSCVRVYSPNTIMIKSDKAITIEGPVKFQLPSGGAGTKGKYLRSGGADGSVYWG